MITLARPLLGDEERAAVDRVLASGMVAQGPEVAAFEKEFATQLLDGRECVAVNSGTSALHLALLALGVGAGDEVIVPSFTFAATANAVALTGATPVFVDIEPVHYTMSADAARAAVTERTVGIIPVHLYGHPADMTALGALAEKSGLFVLEDAAQAHGATWEGRPAGTFGNVAAFSFYPTKNMTSVEGGLVSCADADIARKIRLLRNQGMERQYENEVVGLNNRMTDVHAAVGRVQLGRLPEFNAARQRNAAFYDGNLTGVDTPKVAASATHVYHQYTVRVAGDRDRFRQVLMDEHQVPTGVYYPVPVHALPSFGLDLDLPETRAAAAQVMSLPMHPGLSDDDLQQVVTAINTVAQAGA